MTRRAARRDGNHAAIVATLRSILGSAAVFDAAAVGDGFPDIVVGDGYGPMGDASRRNWLFEIKDPSQPPSGRVLTLAEERFHDAWPGQVAVIYSADDALRVMGRVG